MSLYEKLISKEESLSVVGLGYVGMPLAVAFAAKGLNVIGFDLNEKKINLYKSGIDPTKEVGDEAIRSTTIYFTPDEKDLRKAKFHIVAVPTPVNTDHTPDLLPLSELRKLSDATLPRVQSLFSSQPFTRAVPRTYVSPYLKRNRDSNAA